jgi:hypothetical protein
MDRNEDVRNIQCPGDWRSLAERARVEMDPEKLINLVSELNSALDEQQNFTSGCEFHGNRESHENRSREWHSN